MATRTDSRHGCAAAKVRAWQSYSGGKKMHGRGLRKIEARNATIKGSHQTVIRRPACLAGHAPAGSYLQSCKSTASMLSHRGSDQLFQAHL